jgi:catechol 2,3-dioxygenase-like lactoylglutathione lyase family enzyme
MKALLNGFYHGESGMLTQLPTHFECINPILRVEDMAVSVRYYVDVLGFENAAWGNDSFTFVGREGNGIYLCRGGQGHLGAWVWIGVGDVRALYQNYKDRGAIIRQEPKNESWALEMQIEDPDGNVLRFGSEPEGHG